MLEGNQPTEPFDPGLIDQEITDFVTPRQSVLASLVGASVPIIPGEETAFFPEELEITVGRDLWELGRKRGWNEWQKYFVLAHEIGHFAAMVEDPEGTLRKFEEMVGRTKNLSSKVIEILQQKGTDEATFLFCFCDSK